MAQHFWFFHDYVSEALSKGIPSSKRTNIFLHNFSEMAVETEYRVRLESCAAVVLFVVVALSSILSCIFWKKKKKRKTVDPEAQHGKNRKFRKKRKVQTDNSAPESVQKPVRKMTTCRKMDAPPGDPEPEDVFSLTDRTRNMGRRMSESIRKMSTAARSGIQFEVFNNVDTNDAENTTSQSTAGFYFYND